MIYFTENYQKEYETACELLNKRYPELSGTYTEIGELQEIRSSRYYAIYTEMMENLDYTVLFTSPIHGYKHIERTTLMTLLISALTGVPEDVFRLCMLAAMYHDIGRIDDSWDVFHGERAAKKMNESYYGITKENLPLVSAAIELHSKEDRQAREVFNAYPLEEAQWDTYEIVYRTLKDADALDRYRLMYDEMSAATELKIHYLRIPVSKKLMAIAMALNLKEHEKMWK